MRRRRDDEKAMDVHGAGGDRRDGAVHRPSAARSCRLLWNWLLPPLFGWRADHVLAGAGAARRCAASCSADSGSPSCRHAVTGGVAWTNALGSHDSEERRAVPPERHARTLRLQPDRERRGSRRPVHCTGRQESRRRRATGGYGVRPVNASHDTFGIPVRERAVRVVLPRPDVQRVERIEPEAVGDCRTGGRAVPSAPVGPSCFLSHCGRDRRYSRRRSSGSVRSAAVRRG